MTISCDYFVDRGHAARMVIRVNDAMDRRDEGEWQAMIQYAEAVSAGEAPAKPRRNRASARCCFQAMREAAELAALEVQAERDKWLEGMGWL